MQVNKMIQRVGALCTALWVFSGTATEAGGPLFFNEADGQPLSWVDNRAVFIVEGGPLGAIANPKAKDTVAKAFDRWRTPAVPGVDLDIEDLTTVSPPLDPNTLAYFEADINISHFAFVTCPFFANEPDNFQRRAIECEMFRACLRQGLTNCPSPIIFDHDGKIIDSLFGENLGILGFSGPILYQLATATSGPRILQALTVLNGTFFDGVVPPGSSQVEDTTGDLFLEGVTVHEFGHFLGLGHSDVNGDTALLNGAVDRLATTISRSSLTAPLGPLDLLSTVRADEVETMYPIAIIGIDGTSSSQTLEKDDQVMLTSLYPCVAGSQAATAGRCVPAGSSTGTIAGRVFIPNGQGGQQAAQGVVVIARRIDPSPDGTGVLKDAVSQFTGVTFAPKRCFGSVGSGEDLIQGIFGACENTADCSEQLTNFNGQCGFVSSGLSLPREVGHVDENRFEISGLSPGSYAIQAVQVVGGGFSSLVRTSYGAGPGIRSDDNINLTFFPNPQTGEFYNGDAQGCGEVTTPPCGAETDNSADNPFAYTALQVSAGGLVDHVNVFLNSPTDSRSLVTNAGVNFCALGDVNDDTKVNQEDIREVAKAKDLFEKKGRLTPKADINQDGQVTFIDLDLITDLATIPRPFINSPETREQLSEIDRGIAPFEAICMAAKAGQCQIDAPVGTLRDNGSPDPAICQTAATIGCTVTGCQ